MTEQTVNELVHRLTRLHLALEQLGRGDDWALARSLEERLGSGQYLSGDIERAEALLDSHSAI